MVWPKSGPRNTRVTALSMWGPVPIPPPKSGESRQSSRFVCAIALREATRFLRFLAYVALKTNVCTGALLLPIYNASFKLLSPLFPYTTNFTL